MLDLGFLEDVERILSLTPSGRQTALFSATMPPEIRELADRYLYDPVTVKVKAATLTVDSVEQFHVEVKPARQAREARAGARGRAARPGDRLRAHEDPLRAALPHAARPRDERQGAARRHVPGPARRRDALVQGRARADPRRDRRRGPRARHLARSRTSSTSTSRPRPTSTCTASAAPAASGARAGRSPSSSRARRASSQAIEKHIKTRHRAVGGGREGRARAASRTAPRRHRKPHDAAGDNGARATQAGRQRRPRRGPGRGRRRPRGRRRAGLDGEAIRDVGCSSASRFSRSRRRGRARRGGGRRHRVARPRAARSSRRAETEMSEPACPQMTHDHQPGRHRLELFDDDAPKTVGNFRKLADRASTTASIFHRDHQATS